MSPINVIGMVVCLAGIALHVVLKAVASKGKIEWALVVDKKRANFHRAA